MDDITIGAPPPPFGGWQVVLADPAWPFEDKGSRLAPDSTRPDDQPVGGYETMTVDDICALGPRPSDNSVLFLWTTWTHLVSGSATSVARTWGYEPKTVYPWLKVSVSERPSTNAHRDHPALALLFGASLDPLPGRKKRRYLKLRIGGGHYGRAVSEALVICARGRMPVPTADRLAQVIFAERGSHSAKPTEQYDVAETLYPEALYPGRLEMFVRGTAPRGWSAWGNEALYPVQLR